ncbi:MAG: hypothetical protein HY336_00990 [Candidatus Doudnabacteria bacterium]|nr:hypothetical protein [Candidatus Doudnabacteria bacterium]
MRKHLVLALLCLVGIVAIGWVNASNFNLSTTTYYSPALGHWLSEKEMHAAVHEVNDLRLRITDWRGPYTGKQHFENMKRLVLLEKSLPHGKSSLADARGIAADPGARIAGDDPKWPTGCELHQTIGLETELRGAINFATNDLANFLARDGGLLNSKSYGKDADDFTRMMRESGVDKIAYQGDSDFELHWGQVGWWLLTSQLMSMVLSLGLFALRMQLLEIDPWMLLRTPDMTALWMFFWPAGIWFYPSGEPAKAIAAATRRLAFVLSAMLSFLPATASAQIKKDDGGKKKQAPIVLIGSPSDNQPQFTLQVMTLVRDRYQTMNGIEAYRGPVVQTDVFFKHHSGWFVDAWGSKTFTSNHSFGDELDGTVGWIGKRGKVFVQGVELTSGGNIVQLGGQVFATTGIRGHTFTPYAEIDRLIVTRDTAKNSTTQFWAGVRSAWKAGRRIAVSVDVSVLHETGLFAFREMTMGRIVGDLDLTLNPRLTLKALRVTAVSREQNRDKPGWSFGTGFAVSVP